MNYDIEFKVHRLLGLADQFENDRETRQLIREIAPDTPDEWFAAKARLARELAWALGDSNAMPDTRL